MLRNVVVAAAAAGEDPWSGPGEKEKGNVNSGPSVEAYEHRGRVPGGV